MFFRCLAYIFVFTLAVAGTMQPTLAAEKGQPAIGSKSEQDARQIGHVARIVLLGTGGGPIDWALRSQPASLLIVPYVYPWPQRPAGLIEEAFGELARRWRPILDTFEDAEFNPTGRTGVYGGYQSWVDRPGRFRSLSDGEVEFGGIFSKMAQYDFAGWAVLEWECALKHPEAGAAEGASFIRDHIIRVTDHVLDDFAASGADIGANRKQLELSA